MKISLSKLKLKRKEHQGTNKKSGRNHSGKITVYTKGGGHKTAIRNLNFDWSNQEGLLVAVQYDPNRSAFIGKFWDSDKETFYYNTYPQGLKLFSKITSHFDKKKSSINIGDHAKLEFFDVGDFIHNVELFPNTKAKIARSAGTFAQIIQKTDRNVLEGELKYKNYIRLKLPSKEQRWFLKNCRASLGIIANEDHKNKKLTKAGQSRWLGKRPVVRGVAMNPIDHPHGGGEGKTSGGRPSVSPWGKLTKGVNTRKKQKNKFYIFERRAK